MLTEQALQMTGKDASKIQYWRAVDQEEIIQQNMAKRQRKQQDKIDKDLKKADKARKKQDREEREKEKKEKEKER